MKCHQCNGEWHLYGCSRSMNNKVKRTANPGDKIMISWPEEPRWHNKICEVLHRPNMDKKRGTEEEDVAWVNDLDFSDDDSVCYFYSKDFVIVGKKMDSCVDIDVDKRLEDQRDANLRSIFK